MATATTSTTSIAEFYAGKNVFITGATGFIGKVLVEKLLRSCPGVAGIYCLMRPRRGQTVQERLQHLLQGQVFNNLRNDQPDFVQKVHPVVGDITEVGLGLLDDQKSFLEENIHIVFHSAATIKFDEPLRLAITMNVLAVRKMIELCSRFKKLEALVHVSTAYSNCERHFIDELLYPPPLEPRKLIDALEWLNDDVINDMTPSLIGEKPNTYVYTKHLAEILLANEGANLPIAIIRPSIVTASWMEPMPGWIDNLNGPSGLYVAFGKGMLRTVFADTRVHVDLVPVDLPVNMMIAIGWATGISQHRSSPTSPIPIYHMTTSTVNPFTWGEMEDLVVDYFKTNPMEACFRCPKNHNIMTRNSILHDTWLLISHLIPAYVVDSFYRLAGRGPRMVKLYSKLHKSMEVLEYFTTRSWEWKSHNLDKLKSQMTPEDQKVFYFDPRSIHWPTYMANYCRGTKKYLLKEDEAGIPAAKAHLRKLRVISYLFNVGVLVIMWRLLIAKTNIARNSWHFFMNLVFKFLRFFRLTSSIATM